MCSSSSAASSLALYASQVSSWGQKLGTLGSTIPVMTVPTSPASRASSLFISSHLASSALMPSILALEAAVNSATAAFCSTAERQLQPELPDLKGKQCQER